MISRQLKRQAARNADKIAPILAKTCHSAGPDGRPAFITDPAGLKALERGFKAMLRNMCRPVVLELTPAEGEALRNHDRPPPPPLHGVRHWGAFGLDVATCATFSTNWSLITGLPEAEVVAESERRILERLAEACNRPGLPGLSLTEVGR